MRRLSRDKLGRLFSEAARRLWTSLAGLGSQKALAESLDIDQGHLSRLLYGERKPGRALAERMRVQLGIEPALWDEPPAEPFEPPGARRGG